MNMRTMKVLAAIIAISITFSSLAALIYFDRDDRIILKIFTAGSLSEPFGNMEDGNDMETIFERDHPNVDVQVSSGGSAYMIRRVTDLGQSCDVLASADYSLIPTLMINATPQTADFVIEFARNSMIIAYTDNSAYHDEINEANWPDILRREGVKFGFSNPNHDPCGYRAQMTIQLAELYYNDSWLYDDLVMNNTNMIDVEFDDSSGKYSVRVPSELVVENTDKLMVRDAEVDLTSALESGSLDYLFIYESVAFRHASSGERYIKLPREINLNDTTFESHYAKVSVTQFADNENTSKIKTIEGKPIVYGITIPNTAVNYELAKEFLKMVLMEEGQSVMDTAGQEPIIPGHAGYWKDAVPQEIREIMI